MASRSLQLGSQSIEEIHEQAILLWIHSKTHDPEVNPTHGIFFALTDEAWPSTVPEVADSIELCDALGQAFGQPPLMKEQERQLNIRAFALFAAYRRGGGVVAFDRYLRRAKAIGCALAAIAMGLTGYSPWLLLLAILVWLRYPGMGAKAPARREKPRARWEISVIVFLQFGTLLALYSVSILKLVFR